MARLAEEIHGQISEGVIKHLIELMEKTIGVNTVRVILRKLSTNSQQLCGQQLVMAFTEETQNLLGAKGAFATLRQLGRDLAKEVASAHPREHWEHALEQGLNEMGFARGVRRDLDKAFICSCVFFDGLAQRGLQPTQHAVCWAGWGFIEGFMKLMDGTKHIEWVSRDHENERCEFCFHR